MNKAFPLIVLFSFLFIPCIAQQAFSLSVHHQQKLNRITNGKQKISRYYKYFRQDSLRRNRKAERAARRTMRDHVRKVLSIHDTVPQNSNFRVDSLKKELQEALTGLAFAHSGDSTESIARVAAKQKVLAIMNENPALRTLSGMYKSRSDSIGVDQIKMLFPGIDSLSFLFSEGTSGLLDEAQAYAERKLVEELLPEGFPASSAAAALPGGSPFASPVALGPFSMTGKITELASQRTNPDIPDLLAGNTKELAAAQSKVSSMVDRYKKLLNSQKPEEGIKQKSLQGKSFKEHLVFASHFNIGSLSPFALDLSVNAGYKFTADLWAGFGYNRRLTFADTTSLSGSLNFVQTSYSAFANYNIFRSCFLYAELQKTRNGIPVESSSPGWGTNILAGAGKRFLVHPKLYVTVTAVYNIMRDEQAEKYTGRFQIRTGFQLSELALRKKTNSYDPNQ